MRFCKGQRVGVKNGLWKNDLGYLTTSRQSPSVVVRKYSSAGRSWHNSSVFNGSTSSESSLCRFTRSSAPLTVK